MKPEFHSSDETTDFTLQFRIPPPPAVRPGATFTLPVIIATHPATGRHPPFPDPGQQLMLYASLRDESGRDPAIAGGLTGELSDSLHSLEDDAIRGYSKFDNLSIQRPGRFRIRVYLGIAGAGSQAGLVKKAYVDSQVIQVDPSAETVQKPSKLLHKQSYTARKHKENVSNTWTRPCATFDPS